MRNVDCVSFTVPDLDAAITQYTQGLRLREDVTGVVKEAEQTFLCQIPAKHLQCRTVKR